MKGVAIEVLLIEDNPGDARLIQELLSEYEFFEFECVSRLSDAFQILKRKKFDVIISDLSLPDNHGLDTALKVCKNADNIPQDYLVKGKIDTDMLIRSIRYAIERKKSEQERKKMERNLKDLNDTVHGKTDRIDIKLVECEEYSEIRIVDFGCGIPHEIKDNVFSKGERLIDYAEVKNETA
jgi:CheY-like chemotaxis protein